MRPGINQILLPVSTDDNFGNAVRFTFHLANLTGGQPTVLIIDDDSPRYETTLLPFHTKDLNPASISSELSTIAANNEQMKLVNALSKEYKCDFKKQIVEGHAATQVLLISRYHDFLIMSDKTEFADTLNEGLRRVNPVYEILDQAVIPTILCGENAAPELTAAAIYFDGSPNSTAALHQTAFLYQSSPDEKITIRVAHNNPAIAHQLAQDSANFLKHKGLNQVETEISDTPPISLAEEHCYDEGQLVALGIRSRQVFHDFHIGALAHHFLNSEPHKNKLFC